MREIGSFAPEGEKYEPALSIERDGLLYARLHSEHPVWKGATSAYEREGLPALLPYFEKACARTDDQTELSTLRALVHRMDGILHTGGNESNAPAVLIRALEGIRDRELAEYNANRRFDEMGELREEWDSIITPLRQPTRAPVDALHAVESHLLKTLTRTDRFSQEKRPPTPEMISDLALTRKARARLLDRLFEN